MSCDIEARFAASYSILTIIQGLYCAVSFGTIVISGSKMAIYAAFNIDTRDDFMSKFLITSFAIQFFFVLGPLVYLIIEFCAIVDIIGLILTIVYGSLEGNSDAKSLEIGAAPFVVRNVQTNAVNVVIKHKEFMMSKKIKLQILIQKDKLLFL
ncbi:MAG: hypothetical protein EZS28_037900 [Streblomastix strix]|uniref:Uncharacterized protein n=1 Tax=Streblomastix strix TaxID=222440 RepID=A0A5J4U8N2_9EUKA|nr:MAG: hypothetical protein EZS28_037900 [Streblomastix strix]